MFLCSEFAGIRHAALENGLGKNISIKVSRLSTVSGKMERFSIQTDQQLAVELPAIIHGPDRLHSKWQFAIAHYLKHLLFPLSHPVWEPGNIPIHAGFVRNCHEDILDLTDFT